MTRSASLNSDLAECRQYYDLVPDRLKSPSPDQQSIDGELWVLFVMLVEMIDRIERQLARITLDNSLEQSSGTATTFFRESILPNRSLYSRLASELYVLSHPNAEVFLPTRAAVGSPIEDIFWTGWQYCENSSSDGDDSLASRSDLEDAELLLFSPFFRPDEWLRNAKEIDPLMGSRIDSLLNLSIRIRLRELSHSFVLGNYLAATALCRSMLEYVLIAKASAYGIDPSAHDRNHPNRMKRISSLVDEFSRAVPSLTTDMEAIVDAGNATMHPKRKEVIALLPLAMRENALLAIRALRRVIESLYYPSSGAS